jgi:hypothetical protein
LLKHPLAPIVLIRRKSTLTDEMYHNAVLTDEMYHNAVLTDEMYHHAVLPGG